MVYIQFILEKYTQTFPYKGTSAPALTLHASQLWDCTLLQPRLISHLISQRSNNAASSPQLLPQWDLGWGWSGLHITRHTITATGLFSSSNERKGEASTRHCLKMHFLDVWLVGVQVPPVWQTDVYIEMGGGVWFTMNWVACVPWASRPQRQLSRSATQSRSDNGIPDLLRAHYPSALPLPAWFFLLSIVLLTLLSHAKKHIDALIAASAGSIQAPRSLADWGSPPYVTAGPEEHGALRGLSAARPPVAVSSLKGLPSL